MKNNCHLNSLSSNHPGRGRSRILSTLAAKASRLGFRALLLLFVIASLQTLFVTDARADLTVRAVENADGSATFSLSGTSSLEPFYFLISGTNFSPSLPPLEIPNFFFPLPAGLTLTAGNQSSSLYYVGSQGPSWALYGDYLFPESSTTISGSGTVRVENFPFFVLTPGTFSVEAGGIPNSEEESPEESVLSEFGFYPFVTVYEVIPLDRDPSLSGSAPGTLSSKSGAAVSGVIKITNNGNTPLENLVLSEKSRDFKLGKPLRTSLAPGESTTCKVTFSSLKNSAKTKVLITAATPARIYEAPMVNVAEEEADIEEAPNFPSAITIPGEAVRASVTVKGINASEAGARAPRNPIRLLQSKSGR